MSPIPMCPVPNDCTDAGVQNATDAVLSQISFEWTQPAGFSWRACTMGDAASDECDPAADPTRDNALAFATVFVVQCLAIALGHVILMWKLRRLVAEHRQSRRRAMSDPNLERRARRFNWDPQVATRHGHDVGMPSRPPSRVRLSLFVVLPMSGRLCRYFGVGRDQ